MSKFIDEVEDKFGNNVLITNKKPLDVISTGSLSLDVSVGVGGIPKGRIIEVYGNEGCLVGDTRIMYGIRDKNGKKQNVKGGTLKHLYARFNHILTRGKGNYQRKQTINSIFTVPSINSSDFIIHNVIADVVYSGKKDVFEIETEFGNKLKATKDHRFYIGNQKYVPLSELSIDNIVYVHNNFTNKDENPYNNAKNNLVLLRKEEHDRLHAKKNLRNLSFIVKPSKIKNIKYIGIEDTYDIKCYEPNNNYIANGFVVHNSGKTTLALSIAKNAIKGGDNVFYIDVENMLDHSYAERLTEDKNLDHMTIAQPNTAEDAFIIAEKGILSKEFGLILFDSIGALAPNKEKKDEFDDANVALVPRLLAKFLRRNAFAIRTNNVAFVFLNQVRDQIGSYVQGYNTPGGHAIKHFASIIIFLSKGKEIKQGENTVGQLIKFVVKKNKLAPPFRSYVMPLFFGVGIDFYRDFITFSEMVGIILRAGAYYKFGDIVLGQGMVKSIEFLKEHQEVLDKIKEVVYNITNKYVKEIVEEEKIEPEDK